MLKRAKVAIVGDRESITAFKAVGIDVYPEQEGKDSGEIIKSLARTYAVILVTEEIAQRTEDIINRYKARAYPIVTVIPSAKGATGYALSNISKDVEKAVGSDMLFKHDNKN